LVSFSDSDFNGKECFDCKSISGCIVFFRDMPIVWKSKRQSNVSDEVCYSELYAINFTMKQTLSVKNLMMELKMIRDETIELKVDSSAAKTVAEQSLKSKSRHYDITMLYVNDFIKRNELKIIKIPSEDNIADSFTKFISNKLFYPHREDMKVKHSMEKELRKRK
jgi:histone deacetylase 1/2